MADAQEKGGTLPCDKGQDPSDTLPEMWAAYFGCWELYQGAVIHLGKWPEPRFCCEVRELRHRDRGS